MRMTEFRMRTGIFGLASVALAAAVVAVPGRASAAPVPIDPVAKYELYLSKLSDSGDAGAAVTLNGFRGLPQGNKEEFVDYLDNVEHSKALADLISGDVDEEGFVTRKEKVLFGGDVVLQYEVGVEDTSAVSPGASARGSAGVQATAGDHRAWYSVTDTIFGVKVTKVTVGVNYKTSRTRTLRVYSGYASHYNYVPTSDFSHGTVDKWISSDPGNNAHAETVWNGTLLGSEWDARQRVWADQDGYKGGYLKRD